MPSAYKTPRGHSAFLERRPELVFTGRQDWDLDLDLLRRVNREVNASMVYRREEADVWGEGSDCEDFAIKKMEALLAAGVPRGAMRIAICRIVDEGHAVLIVADTWVLTNGRDDVFARDKSKLNFVAWETDGGSWETIAEPVTLDDLFPKGSA